ncbi:MAG: hypothetical protein RBR53_10965 [Desulforegulaceae bacterium]|nr:hypothetical protein [Desulforegulaceae bacterium]
MVGYAKYSDQLKKVIVEKFLSNPENSVNFIAREAAILASTLKNWLNKSNKFKGFPTNKKNSKKLKPEEKFDILVLTFSMNEVQKSEYCRSHGFYLEELKEWKSECINLLKQVLKRAIIRKTAVKKKSLKEKLKV